MKSLCASLCGLLLVLSMCSARAGDDDRVTSQIRGFYQWYIPLLESAQDRDILKKHRQEMSRYVAANVLVKIARIKADSQEGDYFLSSLDVDPEWAKNIEVSKVKIEAKGRATAEVLLTGKESGKARYKVTLALEGGNYKISAVEPIPDLGAMASAQLKAFYAQYVRFLAHAIGDETPASHETIRDGVTADCLKRATASAGGAQKVDYFLQSSDWDPQWEEHVEIKQAEIAPDGSHGTAEVLLTGEKIPKAHLKVSLKHEQDTYKIDGVEKLAD